jgi:glycosyltransferase involved in cell wall biosynthesis
VSATEGPAIGYIVRRFPKISETFILNEILAMEARGHRIEIFSLLTSRDSRFHGDLGKLKASVHYVPDISSLSTLLRYNKRAARRNRGRYYRALGKVLRTGNPVLFWRFLQSGYIADRAQGLKLNHIHAHFANRSTSAASLASEILAIPYSFTAHAVDIYKQDVKPEILSRKIEAARCVVTVSEANKQFLEEHANGASDKILRIYNGIDVNRFKPGTAAPAGPFTILAVARLVEKKGLDDLIEACHYLRDRGLSFQCWIIGKGKLRRPLQALIKKRNLGDSVKLLGAHSQDGVLERYRRAHLFVLPCIVGSDGNRDGLPVSIVEALSCGLPVVTTAVTGIPEVVQDLHNGMIVPEHNPKALAGSLQKLIVDEGLYKQLKQNARSSVVDRFDKDRTIDEFSAAITREVA